MHFSTMRATGNIYHLLHTEQSTYLHGIKYVYRFGNFDSKWRDKLTSKTFCLLTLLTNSHVLFCLFTKLHIYKTYF